MLTSIPSRSIKLSLQLLCTIMCIGVISSCSKASTPGGLPAACANSSSPYLEYSAYSIRQAVTFADPVDGATGLGRLLVGMHVRYANISLNVWLKNNPECRAGAVAKLAGSLAAIDDEPFSGKDIPAVKELSFLGTGTSDALGLSIGFTPIRDDSVLNSPRPLDVVGVPKSYDDSLMIAWIDMYNSGVNN